MGEEREGEINCSSNHEKFHLIARNISSDWIPEKREVSKLEVYFMFLASRLGRSGWWCKKGKAERKGGVLSFVACAD